MQVYMNTIKVRGMAYKGKQTKKGVRALRGYFGPLWSQKLKIAFHQFHLIVLLEE